MEWHQFLRMQRAKKIAFVAQLTASSDTTPAIHREMLQSLIDEHRRHIIEINQLLAGLRGEITIPQP